MQQSNSALKVSYGPNLSESGAEQKYISITDTTHNQSYVNYTEQWKDPGLVFLPLAVSESIANLKLFRSSSFVKCFSNTQLAVISPT